MDTQAAKQAILDGKTALGIELGSTRIKSVLIGEDFAPLASGAHDWENQLVDGVWTYSLDAVWAGIQDAYAALAAEVKATYGVELNTIGSIGISAMMHGYLPFDKGGNQLAEFRTWRNTMTEVAASNLTELFRFNIPQRWSIAHLYQAILNKENHVDEIGFLTTLAGYVHWQLTGEKVLGVGDASGVFPIDSTTGDYDKRMVEQFDAQIEALNFDWQLGDILPQVLDAGEKAGTLTEAGAKLLDPSDTLTAGIPLCPPEGDAGTGMTATNAVAKRTGNVSAGTSIFAMIVLEKELSQVHEEIDMVTTPNGRPVAMVHCNNCTSDLDAWVKLFDETIALFGPKVDKSELYTTLYNKALTGEADGGGLVSFNYFGGEPITGLTEGRPLLARLPDAKMDVANFMRSLIFSALATQRIGMEILTEKEDVKLEQLMGHGGFFKVEGVGQKLMAASLDVPVTVMESAGEGGPWGMALLAAYMENKGADESLDDFLAKKVFDGAKSVRVEPDAADVAGFDAFMARYKAALAVERAAVDSIK